MNALILIFSLFVYSIFVIGLLKLLSTSKKSSNGDGGFLIKNTNLSPKPPQPPVEKRPVEKILELAE